MSPNFASLLSIALATVLPIGGVRPDPVDAFARRRLAIVEYMRVDRDLDGDGHAEVLLYATDDGFCGSGGCTLFVLSGSASGYRLVMRATVSQLPIMILKTSTHGWHDIGITVSGGGSGDRRVARMRFDGRRYPDNPTVRSIPRLSKADGEVVLSRSSRNRADWGRYFTQSRPSSS